MTLAELLREGAARFDRREGLPDPPREARWLLARALDRPEAWLLAHAADEVPSTAAELFRGWVARRGSGEPAHYIVGSCPFWGREFLVSPAALIPRPETELIVECTLRLPVAADPRVVDIGTGCGCLAVTLALEFRGASVAATDISVPALELARRNAHRFAAPVRFAAGNLAAALRPPFDLVVANLPYLPAADIAVLPTDIRDFEPGLALAGGEDGAELLRRLIPDLPRLLAPTGFALLEMGPLQRERLHPMLAGLGLAEVERGLDHAGIERVLVLRRL
ncbi:MAG TPA: peptide chain release factor N(5)-glutamine methyltransferase [Thermoanaerobaculaceae bacterium]|nr:peptide chain release factor N(5)-glutamine methyltransferase [Thermoanaerobaculaceae bacterium]